MPLNPAVPTLIGQPQTARKNVHTVNMPNPLGELADSLGNLGKSGLHLGLSIAAMKAERDDADYIRTRNEIQNDAIQQLNSTVFNQDGFAAEGSLERTTNIAATLRDKYSEKVSAMTPKNRRRLEEDMGVFWNNQQNQAMRYEHSQVNSAKVQANKKSIDYGVDQYAATLDEAVLESALQTHADNWRIQNGGYLVDADSIRRFDEDVNDGDGFVQVRGGMKMKIVEDDSEDAGKPGTITKSAIKKQREGMVDQANAYAQSRQELIDMAHAKAIDNYLAHDDPAAAERYLYYLQQTGAISDSTKAGAEVAIGKSAAKLSEKARVERERAESKLETEQNKQERKNLQRINTLLEANRIEEAEGALQEMVYLQAGGVFQISPEAYNNAKITIERHKEVAEVANKSIELRDSVIAQAAKNAAATAAKNNKVSPNVARYGGPEQDVLFDAVIADIQKTYTGERARVGQQLVSRLKQLRSDLEEQQKNNATQDVIATMQVMQNQSLTTAERRDYVQKLPESQVKTALLKALDRQEEAERQTRRDYDNNPDVAFNAQQQASLNQLKLDISKRGVVTQDGIRYDLSDENPKSNKGLVAYVKTFGLTSANEKKVAEYISNSNARIDALQAGVELATQLGMESPTEALRWYPSLLDDLEEIKGKAVIEQGKMSSWLKTNISYLIEQKATSEDGGLWYFDKEVTIGELPGVDPGDIGPENTYMTKDQLLSYYRAIRAQRALQYGDTEGAAQALKETPDAKTLGDFARKRRFQERKGKYYFTGGK